jgi:crotonobetainyl-CoA:carnitine CoA-transferase CaiB-like acyl-CoA transferase
MRRSAMFLPLGGIKVLDFSIAVASPLGGAMLSDMGAEVTKVERVQGEAQRLGLPAGMDEVVDTRIKEGAVDNASWIALNRGKKDLAIDIRTDQGKEIVLKMAAKADVILESFRPGVMERLGLGYETVGKLNPKVIYCSFTGYGETGPLAHRAGGDMWSQAMSGMVSEGNHPGGRPQMLPLGLIDNTSGILIAYAVMTALFVREKTGMGQKVSLNNLNAAMYLQFGALAESLMGKSSPLMAKEERGMTPPSGAYRAKDGDVLTIFGADPLWPSFCKVVGVEHLTHDARFENDKVRRKHRQELEPILDEAFSRKTREEWQRLFREAKMRCDSCLTLEEVCAHPQIEANEIIYTTRHPVRGEIRMLGIPLKLNSTPVHPQGPSPLLGQHTEEILLGLGYTSEDIVRLEADGIIKTTLQKNGI